MDDIVNGSIRMDDPVAQELQKLLRQTTYDVPGLLQGNPSEPMSRSPNPSGWGDMFAMDKQVAFAKNLKEGWLTTQESADLDRWNASTSWVDRMYGYKLEPGEKAEILTGMGVAGAMALMAGRAGVGSSNPKGAGGGKPIEFDGKFYSVDGLKFSKDYYDRLWREGRPAPFLQAREVLSSNPRVIPDPRGAPGYFKYEGGGLEMIYNPTTGQVGHIQPIRGK